jgi:hypothetical protein
VWLRKNDSGSTGDVPDSDTKLSLQQKHGSTDGYGLMTVNYMMKLNAGDFIEMIWSSGYAGISIQSVPAGTAPVSPSIPGVIFTAQQVMNTQSGFSGYSGISGFSGISGYSGYSGSGVSGWSGISGYSGAVGPQGISGYSGYSGSGVSGWSGISGYSGATGLSGFSGYSGATGPTTYPAAGVAISTGTAWGTSLTAPTGALVGTSDTQTLTGKTVTNVVFDGNYTEDVYAIVDGASVDLNPANGTVQTWTLGASRSPTATGFQSGQSITLMIDDGSAYTITWPSLPVTWKTDSGSAPTLNTTGITAIVLWKVGSVIYGARVGNA